MWILKGKIESSRFGIAFFIGIFKQFIHRAIKELEQFIGNRQFNSDGMIVVHAGQCIPVNSYGISYITQV